MMLLSVDTIIIYVVHLDREYYKQHRPMQRIQIKKFHPNEYRLKSSPFHKSSEPVFQNLFNGSYNEAPLKVI